MGNKPSSVELSNEEISLLEDCLELSKRKILFWLDEFLSDFPSGFITKSEFIDIYKHLYRFGKPKLFAKFVFDAFDTCKISKLGFGDFVLATAFLMTPGKSIRHERQRLNLLFDVFDLNHDEVVDETEFLTVYKAILDLKGYHPVYAKIKVLNFVKRNDANGNRTFTRDAFVNAMERDKAFSSNFI